MKLGIMQPYFFPYIGYFQLMSEVDEWVVFDDIQFIDKGWINRNRILHPDVKKEWQYITVPLKKRGQFDNICEISISENIKWKEQLLGKLTCYKKKAPYYDQTIDFIRSCLSSDQINLSMLIIETLQKTAEFLSIDTKFHVQSEMNLDLGKIENPGQWALRISEAFKASEYINPHGGIEIFNEDEYEKKGVKLRFIKPRLGNYIQRRDGFVSGLSIIDVMMWNSEMEIHHMMNEYDICLKNEVTGNEG